MPHLDEVQMDHHPCPLYSTDLSPSDFYLLMHLKSFLADHHFDNQEVFVQECLTSQTASFYEGKYTKPCAPL